MIARLFGAAALLVLAALSPGLVHAQVLATPSPGPTPTPIPVSSPGALPYPAYGTPMPGAASVRAIPGVPSRVTLQQAIDIAVAKSPVLAEARANYQLTQVQVQLARTALYPNIGATGTVTHSHSGHTNVTFSGNGTGGTVNGSGNGGNGGALGGGNSTSYGINLQLQQLIYDGGRTRAQIEQATANEVAGAYTYQRELQTLAYNVAQAYYNALAAEASTQLSAQVVQQNVVQENLVTAQLRAGTASRVDLATAQLPTAQARVSLVKAQGTELSSLAAFANSMGLDADADVAPANDPADKQTNTLVQVLTYDQALRRALALRPDYFSQEYAVQAAQYNIRVQQLGYFPTLSGTASIGTNSTSVAGTNFTTGNQLGLQVNIPIFNQGVTKADIEQARVQLALAQTTLLQTEQSVQLNVRQALAGLVSAQSAIYQAQVELSKAQEVLRATQAQYRAGVTTLPLLLNAQVGLTQAQTDYVSALYGLRQAEQTYLYSLGESDLHQPA
ncbi:MAG: TolC family protein [Candidatus Eremiobacteraeota bacterium]|nr:TolC family protein [Candidatus Eremiobacteraeota bacterium]